MLSGSFNVENVVLFGIVISVSAESGAPGCGSVCQAYARSIVTSFDPCHDFYDFACGGLLISPDHGVKVGRHA